MMHKVNVNFGKKSYLLDVDVGFVPQRNTLSCEILDPLFK